jgi:lysophospholipase L1-like esterase
MLRSSCVAITALLLLAPAACGSSGSSNSPNDNNNGGGGADSGHPGTGAGGGDAGSTGNTGDDSGGGGGGGGPEAGGGVAEAGPVATPLTDVKSYVILGDSISMGGGQAPFYYDLLASNDDTQYPAWQGKDLKTKYGASLMVVNNAVAGSVSADLPGQVTKLPASLPGPVHVTITIGGNDMVDNIIPILQGTDQQLRTTFGSNIASALGQLTMPGRFGAGVEVRIFEADIYDPSDGTGNLSKCPAPLDMIPAQNFDPYFSAWNSVVDTTVPKEGMSVVAPLHMTFRGHGVNSSDNWYYSDCIHPNAKGHVAIRGMFWSMITGETGPAPM